MSAAGCAQRIVMNFERSQCSCGKCDSEFCFIKRQQAFDQCKCRKCEQSKTCLFVYSNNKDPLYDRKSQLPTTESKCHSICMKTDTSKSYVETVDLKQSIASKNRTIEPNNKIDDLLTFGTKYKNKSDVIKAVQETNNVSDMVGNKFKFVASSDSAKVINNNIKHKSSIVNSGVKKVFEKDLSYKVDCTKHIKQMTKESLLYTKLDGCEIKNESNKLVKERNYKGPALLVNNVLTLSRAEIRPSTAKLSAEIMNVPYKDFQNSIKNKCDDDDPYLHSSSTRPAAVKEDIHLNVNIEKNKSEGYSTQEVDLRNQHNQETPTGNKNENSISDSPLKTTKLSKYDILRRIQEAYNACSCKVCECIASISQPVQNDDCKCKPCECIDCLSFMTRLIQLESRQTFNDNYLMRHDLKSSKEFKWMSNSAQKCNCKPCDCIRCTKTIIECCDCEPCQCINCKYLTMHGLRTVIVAPVGEENQRNVCQCSTCGCFECGHVYGATATSRTHEISTGISRHRNCRCENCINDTCVNNESDTCSCERHDKVMRKPVQRDNDYGIHRVDINYNNKPIGITKQLGSRKSARHDAIAMHTMVTNTFRSPAPKGQINNGCDCSVCECIACPKNMGAPKKLLQSNISFSNKVINVSNILDTCTCSACECEICSRRKNRVVPNEYKNNCKCEECDCIDCVNLQKSTNSITDKIIISEQSVNKSCLKGLCKCQPCECIDRQIMMLTCAEDICYYCTKCNSGRCENQKIKDKGDDVGCKFTYTVKEGELSNTYLPLISERYLDYSILGNKQGNSIITNENKFEYVDCHSNFNNKNNSEKDIFICHSFPKSNINGANSVNSHAIRIPCVIGSSKEENIPYLGIDDGAIKAHTLKCDACIQCRREHKTRICKETNEQVSVNYISALSSSATIKTSNIIVRNSGNISPIPVRNNMAKSPHQSSCNSSGHDHSDYLIRFPRSTVEVCISDVMKLNLDKKLNMKRLHVSSNLNTENNSLHSPEFSYDQIMAMNQKNITNENRGVLKPVEQILPNLCQKLNRMKSCECRSCACNKCDLKIPKSDRCECMCPACNCFGMCLGGNQHIFIRKNEGTQTKRRFSYDDSQDNMDKHGYTTNGEHLTQQIYPLPTESQEPQISGDCDTFKNSINNSYNIKQFAGKEGTFSRGYGYIAHNNNKIPVISQINYESVQNTLREAREFSLKLMQILEKYEKANREFKTTSHTLKHFHSNDKHLDETKNKIKLTEELKKEVKSKIGDDEKIIDSVSKINITNNVYDANYINVDNQCESKNMKLCDIKDLQNERLNYSLNSKIDHHKAQYHQDYKCNDTEIENESEDNHCSNKINEIYETTHIDLVKGKDIKNKYRNYRKLIKRAVIMSRRFHSKIAAADRVTSNLNRRTSSSGTLHAHKVAKEIEDKQITFPTSNLKESVGIEKADTKTHGHHDLVKVMKQLNLVVETNGTAKVVNLTPRTTSSANEAESILVMKDKTEEDKLKDKTEEDKLKDKTGKAVFPEVQENERFMKSKESIQKVQDNVQANNNQKTWPLTKKHFYMNTLVPYTRRNDVLTIPPLELDVKKTSESISLEMAITSELNKLPPTFTYHKNVALANLQIEVNKLRDMPVLQSDKEDYYGTSCRTQSFSKITLSLNSKEESNTRISSPSHQNEDVKITHRVHHQSINPETSAASQFDKIIFEGIQRVSDHTILVKWQIPQNTSNIQGYELLVDGRAVQKILSPNRNMAVITCLPHIEKVLLTISIITSTATEPGTYPSTTIVYRPRVK